MAIHPDGEAPYTSAPAAIAVIDRFRKGTLQTPITQDVLRRAGVPEGLVRRTHKALRLLELIDDGGRPTEQFIELRKVRPEEYQAALADYLRSVYRDVFTYTDPANGDIAAVKSAFWGYKPHGQIDTMVRLFLGLCEHAGLIPEQPKRERPAASSPRKTKDATTSARTHSNQAKERKQQPTPTATDAHAEAANASGAAYSAVVNPPSLPLDGIDQALVVWFQRIPKSGTPWAKEDKDRWFTALRAMVDGVHPDS